MLHVFYMNMPFVLVAALFEYKQQWVTALDTLVQCYALGAIEMQSRQLVEKQLYCIASPG